MLNYLVVQTIVSISTFVFAHAGLILKKLYEEYHKPAVRIVSRVLGCLAILCAIYYWCDVLLWNCYEFSDVGNKILLFVTGVVAWCMAWGIGKLDDSPIMASIIILIVTIIFILLFAFAIKRTEEQAIYDEKIVEQSPQVQTQQYELISASDGTNIEGNLNGESSGSFFLISGTMSSNVNGEIKQTDVYKFYYVANSKTGEIRLMTVNANSTSIFYVEEGEDPYLLKKVITPYSLDYNVDPPQKCNVGKSTVTYELHIPKGSIVGSFEFNNN